MTEETNKKLKTLGILLLGLFIAFVIGVYVFFDCWEENNIGRNTLYCYFCISSNIRNFPLVGLEGEPSYSVNLNVWEPNYSHPPYYALSFSSTSSHREILNGAKEYLKINSFELFEENCAEAEMLQNCSYIFTGTKSLLEIRINADKSKIHNSLSEVFFILAEETFIESIAEYKAARQEEKILTDKAQKENRCSKNENVIKFADKTACISQNIGDFPITSSSDKPTYTSNISVSQSSLTFQTTGGTQKIIKDGKAYIESKGFKMYQELLSQTDCFREKKCYAGEFESKNSRLSFNVIKNNSTDKREETFTVTVAEYP